MGIILPSIREETCLQDNTASQVEAVSIDDISSSTTLTDENNEAFTQISSGDQNVEFGTLHDLKILDLNIEKLYHEDWCTNYPTFSSEIEAGIVDGGYGLCGITFDDAQQEILFTMPTSSNPVCDDSANIWTGYIEQLDDDLIDGRIHLAIDISTSKIFVTGVSSQTVTNDRVFIAHFRLPDG